MMSQAITPIIQFARVREVRQPEYGTGGSAGIDFFIPNDFESSVLLPGEDIKIPSGIHVKLPEGYALVMMNKSGVAVNKKLIVGAQVIDSDYQGEIHIHLFNISQTSSVKLESGMKIIQGLLIPVPTAIVQEVLPIEGECAALDVLYPEVSERGKGGFGSTGV